MEHAIDDELFTLRTIYVGSVQLHLLPSWAVACAAFQHEKYETRKWIRGRKLPNEEEVTHCDSLWWAMSAVFDDHVHDNKEFFNRLAANELADHLSERGVGCRYLVSGRLIAEWKFDTVDSATVNKKHFKKKTDEGIDEFEFMEMKKNENVIGGNGN